MTILRMLDTATAHITRADAVALDTDEAAMIVYPKGEYGWFLPLPGSDTDLQDRIDAARQAGMSRSFTNLISYAYSAGCHWLCLDRDADPVPGLPTHDW